MASQPPRALNLSAAQSLGLGLGLGLGADADALGDGLVTPRTPSAAAALRALNNPLSSKVSSVLASSYADADFRDSLELLDERHVQNNAETRRRLRLDVQKDVIDSNGEVIAEFGRVAEQLRRIGGTIETLNTTYDSMKAAITAAHSATKPALDEASVLMERRRQVETRRRLLGAFVGHFVLDEDETAALTQTAEPVDERFFAVLNKAKKISEDCEVLLGFESSSSNRSLGSEIMEQTSRNTNLGYQKLYKWVQREFRHLNLENPQIGSAMSRALRVLAERPAMFQNCLDAFAEARESILADAFYVALTGSTDATGAASGATTTAASASATAGAKQNSSAAASAAAGVKPIELAAHDPLRYAGDMLAWTHSATVSEREALEALFVGDGGELARELQEGRKNEVWRLAEEEGDEDAAPAFDPVRALNDLVDRDLAGVGRLLRQRMQQVVQTNEDTILAYKLANLLNFYRITFSKLLGSGSGGSSGDKNESGTNGTDSTSGTRAAGRTTLVETLDGLEADALRHFRGLLRDHVAALQGEFAQAPADAVPPEFLQDALEQLVAIMKTFDTSLAAPDGRAAAFAPVLAEALDPFLDGCAAMAARAANTADRLVFAMNCRMAARDTLAPYDFANARAAALQAALDADAAALADNQYGFLCEQSGVEALFAALAPLSPTRPDDVAAARRLDQLQPAVLARAGQRLDDFLPSALMDAVENLKPLQDPKLARLLTEEAAERFCTSFEHVEAILDAVDATDATGARDEGDAAEVPPDPTTTLRGLFPRTTVEIRVLLS